MSSTMPFITLPDAGLRINLFNVNFISEQEDGSIAIHFNDEGHPEVVEGDAATRIKAFWDGVAETLSLDADSDDATDGRDFALGNADGPADPPDPRDDA